MQGAANTTRGSKASVLLVSIIWIRVVVGMCEINSVVDTLSIRMRSVLIEVITNATKVLIEAIMNVNE